MNYRGVGWREILTLNNMDGGKSVQGITQCRPHVNKVTVTSRYDGTSLRCIGYLASNYGSEIIHMAAVQSSNVLLILYRVLLCLSTATTSVG